MLVTVVVSSLTASMPAAQVLPSALIAPELVTVAFMPEAKMPSARPLAEYTSIVPALSTTASP